MERSSQVDKSWIHLCFPDPNFVIGVKKFVELAAKHRRYEFFMPCPCRKCRNLGGALNHETVKEHCYRHGFDTTYSAWYLHGEGLGGDQDAQKGPNIQNPGEKARKVSARYCKFSSGECFVHLIILKVKVVEL